MRVALAGDLVLTRPVTGRGPARQALVAYLRDADLAVANLEGVLCPPDIPAAATAGGLWLRSSPTLAAALPAMGIAAVSRANNHAGDYGTAGMAATTRHLEEAGVAHAGCGADLPAARRAAVVATPGGRVALVACTMTCTVESMAGAPRGPVPGRPGVSMVRVHRTYRLDPARFAFLQECATALGLGPLSEGGFQPAEVLARDGRSLPELRAGLGPDALVLLGERFVRADACGVDTRLHARDVAEVLAAVREAAAAADVTVLCVHAHHRGAAPAAYVRTLALAAVEAGADVVAVHGSHEVGPVELVDGAVILHGLGNLVFQLDGLATLPAAAYDLHELGPDATPADVLAWRARGGRGGFAARPRAWQGLVARARFGIGRVAAVDLLPVDLGHGRPPGEAGDPGLAGGPLAAEILDRVASLSAELGTRIDRVGDTGVVRPPG